MHSNSSKFHFKNNRSPKKINSTQQLKSLENFNYRTTIHTSIPFSGNIDKFRKYGKNGF